MWTDDLDLHVLYSVGVSSYSSAHTYGQMMMEENVQGRFRLDVLLELDSPPRGRALKDSGEENTDGQTCKMYI